MVDRLLAVDGGLQGERLRAAGVDRRRRAHPRRPGPTADGDASRTCGTAYPFGHARGADRGVRRRCTDRPARAGGRRSSRTPPNDVDLWAHVVARGLVGAGATPRSMIHNAYGYGLFTGGLGIHHGARALGATVVPMSGGQTARQLRLIQDLQARRPDVYARPTRSTSARRPGPRASTRRRCRCRVGMHGAEPWTDAMREQIESLLGHPGAGHLRPVRDHRARAWPARRSTRTAGCTCRRTTSWSRRSIRRPAGRCRTASWAS